MSVLKINSIDVDKIELKKPEKINNVYYSNISYNGDPLIVQLDKVNNNKDLKDIDNIKFPSIELDIPKRKNKIYNFFISLDNNNIKQTISNSKDWFQKNIPPEVIDQMYKRISKSTKNESNSILKFKLPISKGKIVCKSYNEKGEEINISSINENSTCSIILHIRGLKFLKQHYICDCYVSQIKLHKKINNIIVDNKCLINESINDSNDILDTELLENIDNQNKLKSLIEEINNKEREYIQLKNNIVELKLEQSKLLELIN